MNDSDQNVVSQAHEIGRIFFFFFKEFLFVSVNWTIIICENSIEPHYFFLITETEMHHIFALKAFSVSAAWWFLHWSQQVKGILPTALLSNVGKPCLE